MNPFTSEEIESLVQMALAEDVGPGDVTSLAVVPEETEANAVMISREPMVAAGLFLAVTTFRGVSAALQIEPATTDGRRLNSGVPLLKVKGPARAILTAERVALNFVQRLSGVATATSKFVEAIQGTGARILDTRKTTPGWRRLEKYAVKCGGGENHRLGLYDMVLIKDNHLAALWDAKPNPIAAAIERARAAYPNLKIEVETDSIEQVEQALNAGANLILLDNMSVKQLRQAVTLCQGRAQTEASGGVNLATARSIAETGVDFISVGAITHSARAMDVALDFEL